MCLQEVGVFTEGHDRASVCPFKSTSRLVFDEVTGYHGIHKTSQCIKTHAKDTLIYSPSVYIG
jgi:hypothetical protein